MTNTRMSQADFGKHREYMLALDGKLVYVGCDCDRNLRVASSLSPDQYSQATEWVAEVSKDITSAYGGDPAEVYQLIHQIL